MNSILNKEVLGTVTVTLVGLSGVGAAEAAAVRTGFDANVLGRNDDGSVLAPLGFTANFFGTNFNQVYVNNNGNLTFGSPLRTFIPFDLTSTGQSIIAPFFADVDTRGPGQPVNYGVGTVNGRTAFAANYVDVAHFNQNGPLNSFQVVLIDRSDTGQGNFAIEFNYDQILWEAGQASGSTAAGLGGNSARVGFSNGSGAPGTFLELTGSAVNGAFLDSGPVATSLIQNSLNSNVNGRYVFFAENGLVTTNPTPVPEPLTILGSLAALGLGGAMKRKFSA